MFAISEIAGGVDATVGVLVALRACSLLFFGESLCGSGANPAIVGFLLALLLAVKAPCQESNDTDQDGPTNAADYTTDNVLT